MNDLIIERSSSGNTIEMHISMVEMHISMVEMHISECPEARRHFADVSL